MKYTVHNIFLKTKLFVSVHLPWVPKANFQFLNWFFGVNLENNMTFKQFFIMQS